MHNLQIMNFSVVCIIHRDFVLVGYEQEERLHKTYPCHGQLDARADAVAPLSTRADPAVRPGLLTICFSSRVSLQVR